MSQFYHKLPNVGTPPHAHKMLFLKKIANDYVFSDEGCVYVCVGRDLLYECLPYVG